MANAILNFHFDYLNPSSIRNLLSKQGEFVLHWVSGYILPVIETSNCPLPREQNILFLYKNEFMETEDKE